MAPPATTVVAAAKPTKAFCDLLRSYVGEAQRITVTLTDRDALRPMLDDAAGAVIQSASIATPAVAPDVATLRTVLTDVKAGLEAVGYDFRKLAPDVAMRLMSPQFAGALGRLQSVLSEEC